jgi:hypothetical protein
MLKCFTTNSIKFFADEYGLNEIESKNIKTSAANRQSW